MYPKGFISRNLKQDFLDEWIRVFEARHGKIPCIQTEPHEDTLSHYNDAAHYIGGARITTVWVDEITDPSDDRFMPPHWRTPRCSYCRVVLPTGARRCDMCGAPV